MASWPLATILVLAGLVALFFGFRAFRLLMVLAGALLGFAYGPVLFELLVGPAGPGVQLLSSLAGALLFALVAWFAFIGAVFFWGAAFGYALASSLFPDALILSFGVAVVLGILAVVFERVLIIALTAWAGAWTVVTALAWWLGFAPRPQGPVFDPRILQTGAIGPVMLTLVAVLALAGALFQFRSAGLGGRARRRPSY